MQADVRCLRVRLLTTISSRSRTRSSRRSARGCHSGANAPQGLRLDAGNSYAHAGERRERRGAGPHARQPGQSRHQLPGAEDPGQRRGRCAHARERSAVSHAGADRSRARLDRRRRAAECGAGRSADRGQQHSRGLGAGGRGSRQAHHHLQRRCRQFARERQRVRAARCIRSARQRRRARSGRTAERGRDHDGAAARGRQLSTLRSRRRTRAARRPVRSRARRRCRRQARRRHAHSVRCHSHRKEGAVR